MGSAELNWLVVTIVFTAFMWVPYIVNRILENGLWPALQNPEPDGRPKAAWAYRAECAHRNAVENLVIFAPLALGVAVLGVGNSTTAMAAMVYFVARAAHWVIYVAGIPLLRTITFFVGFLCQLALAQALWPN